MINSLSICIPTYNRITYLKRCINSFISQRISNFDYEFVIVDDGSNDATKEYLLKIKNKINLKYYYQSNQGRLTALHKAINKAEKKYICIMDDDCYFTPNLIMDITKLDYKILNDTAGFAFLRVDEQNKIKGNLFKKNISYTDLVSMRFIYKKKGEMFEFVRKDILKSYLYPLFKNEKRISTDSIWIPMSELYKFYFINIPLRVTPYLEDGISNHLLKNKINSPNASIYHEYQILKSTKIFTYRKILSIINIGRYILHGGLMQKKINLILKIFIYLFMSFSICLFLFDKYSLVLKYYFKKV